MKKYLMIGFAAVAFAACSNHDFETYSQEQIIQNEYKANFVAEFGQPASNHTWGFGASTRSVAPAFTRALVHNVNFPDAPAASDYKLTIGDATYGDIYNNGNCDMAICNNVYIDEKIKNVHVWGQGSEANGWKATGGVLYVTGDVKLDYFYFAGNGSIVYITQNSSLTIPSKTEMIALNGDSNGHSENIQGGTTFYLAPGAKLITNGALKLNSATIYVASTAEVHAASLENNGTGILYNQGLVDLDGDLSVKNANSFIVNEGEISAENYGSEGSGSFWNTSGAIMTVNNKTTVNSNSNGWINDGTYTTGTFLYNAGSVNVWNNCRLNCTTIFDMTLGDSSTSAFQMDGGAGIYAASFHIAGPARITMGDKSIIKVSGTATLDCTKAEYGIYGPTTGYAVFQANKIEKGTENQGYEVTYGNNLYVYSETTHFEDGLSGSYPYIDAAGTFSKENNIFASNWKSGKPAISWTSTTVCNDGFSGDTPNSITYTGRIMVEDLSAQADVTGKNSDWDFNDVVFDWAIDGGKAYIRLLAAGGTLPIRIGGTRNDTSSEPVGSVEIHTDAERGLGGYMKNCGVGDKVPYKEFVLEDHTYDTAKNILITVYKGGSWVEVLADQGEPAAKFNCKVGTNWCDEYVNITRVYPSFKQWVENPTVDWTNLAEDKARLVDGILSNNAPAE